MQLKLFYYFFLFFISQFAVASKFIPVTASNEMVVSKSPIASQVGLEILKQGGNAVDAAIAVGYAMAVVEPGSGNLAGGGFMLIHLKNGKNIFINFREKAPLAINQKLYFKNGKADTDLIQKGYLAVGVPGTVMGLNTALKKYGTMSLAQVMQPAIQLAQNGFLISPGFYSSLKGVETEFAKQPNVAEIFLQNGKVPTSGTLFKQPLLAKTLELISQQSDRVFYHGEIAKEIVKASDANGGVLSLKDFAKYNITFEKPIYCDYHGYEIITAPPPSSGGVTLCEMLEILEPYPLTQYGFHSAQASRLTIEAMRYAYRDRNQYLGDPAFVKNPVQRLLSPAHIKSIQAKINSQNNFVNTKASQKPEPMQTTNYSVVDKAGNAVVVTYTLNGFFGNKMMAGNTGFFLNNEMDDFTLQPGVANMFGLIQGEANSIQPGKRPLSSMTPTIVLKDGKVKMLLGAAGGSTITTQVLQEIINVINFNMNVAEAINAPRLHMQDLPNIVFMEPGAFSFEVEKQLRIMGYQFKLGFFFPDRKTWGESNGIERDFNKNLWLGSADYRYHGAAVGD